MDHEREQWNRCRYRADDRAGHYESYFQRANHPTRPLAFWIRYTIFSPADRPGDGIGELWAIWFDGEADRITAVKREVPLAECSFDGSALAVQMPGARLDAANLIGTAQLGAHTIGWDLSYRGDDPPLLLLPRALYGGSFPKAKALVGTPNAVYRGTITVDGEVHEISDWVGSQNHNWGSKHTDRYAWGQVAGFDGVPNSFFECGSARLKVGPVWTPLLTVMVLRVEGEEYRLNSLLQSVRAEASVQEGWLDWRFRSKRRRTAIEGRIYAPRSSFVGLTYFNPPGGSKTCLNSKLATCVVRLRRRGRAVLVLRSERRAAFEMLTDSPAPGIPMAT